MKSSLIAVCGMVVALQTGGAVASDTNILGAGSSAAAPIYQSWAHAYSQASGVEMVYESVGSTAGLKRIRAHETDFGGSDVAPSEVELTTDGLVVFPIAITGIAPVVNLPKLVAGQLRLSGEVLARIYLGEVTLWNAPEIMQLNPGLTLPGLPIRVVVRGDGSGTTYNFADYLAKVSPSWKSKRGVKSSYAWPESFLAVKGSSGVVTAVKQTSGAIGYVDFGYVEENQLDAAQMRNADGVFLKPSIPAFRQALFNSEWASKGAFTATLTNKPGKSAWPLTMGTFAVLPKVTDKPEQTQRALKFFVWAFTHGDALVQQHNFVRLPDRVQAAAFKAISSIKDTTGRPIGMMLF